jgi:hypothetical protein
VIIVCLYKKNSQGNQRRYLRWWRQRRKDKLLKWMISRVESISWFTVSQDRVQWNFIANTKWTLGSHKSWKGFD